MPTLPILTRLPILTLVVLLTACGPTRTPSDNNPTNNATVSTNNGTSPTTNAATDGECRPLDPALGACDPLCQTGCMDGENCSISSPDAFSVLEAICESSGPGTAGMECSSDTGCEPGLGCLSLDGLTFECVPFCRVGGGVPPCTGENVCTPFDRDERRIGICVPPEDACTQFPDDDCPEGRNCHRTELGLRCVSYDAEASVGDDCATPTDCNDAQGCIDVEGRSQCRELCDPSNPMCAAGNDCGRLNDLPYGACVP